VSNFFENIHRHERLIIITGLGLLVILAAAYTILGVGMPMSSISMTQMAIDMPKMIMQPENWVLEYALLVFLMWCVMMIAMMLPSAAPAILLFAGIARKRETVHSPFIATSCFVLGYLSVWTGFSAIATLLQWGLEAIGTMNGMMEITSTPLAASVLVMAGLYQLTPYKSACLKHCQHPLFFMIHHWMPGNSGAIRMGLVHGGYCLGCCWFLMMLLFVGGIMNLFWITGIAIYVGIEKLTVNRPRVTSSIGMILLISGIWLIADYYLVS